MNTILTSRVVNFRIQQSIPESALSLGIPTLSRSMPELCNFPLRGTIIQNMILYCNPPNPFLFWFYLCFSFKSSSTSRSSYSHQEVVIRPLLDLLLTNKIEMGFGGCGFGDSVSQITIDRSYTLLLLINCTLWVSNQCFHKESIPVFEFNHFSVGMNGFGTIELVVFTWSVWCHQKLLVGHFPSPRDRR